MYLTPYNSSNPDHWGKEVYYVNGIMYLARPQLPSEVDFSKEILGYHWNQGIETFKQIYGYY